MTPPKSFEIPKIVGASDPTTGKSIGVGVGDATGDFLSGKIGFAAGSDVEVKDASGKTTKIKAENLYQHLQDNPLASIAGQGTIAAKAKRAEYEDSYLSQAAAFGTGAVKQLLLGGGDAALVKGAELLGGAASADKMRERIRAYDEVFPTTRGAGEFVGFAAPILATLGSGAVVQGAGRGAIAGGARLATAAPRALTGLSGAAERGILSAVGEGVGGRAVAMGAQGAIENAVYGIGDYVSQSTVADTPLTAQGVLGAIGHGALLGGIGGGVIGAGSKLVPKALVAGEQKIASLLEKAEKSEAVQKLVSTLEKNVPGLQNLEATAQKRAFALAAGGDTVALERLAAMPEKTQLAASKLIIEELPSVAGQKSLATTTREQLAQHASDLRKTAALDELTTLKSIDKLKPTESVARFDQSAVREVLARDASALAERDILALEKSLSRADKIDTIGAQFRVKNAIETSSLPAATKQAAIESIDAQIARRVESRAPELGEAWARELEAKTARRQAADWVAQASTRQPPAPSVLELARAAYEGDKLTGGIVGSVVGLGLGPAAGGLAGSLASAGAGVAKKYLESASQNATNAMLATVANRAAQGELSRAVTSTINEKIASAVKNAIGAVPGAAQGAMTGVRGINAIVGGEQPRAPEPPKTKQEIQNKFHEYASVYSLPVAEQRARIDNSLKPLYSQNPQLASTIANQATVASEFLQSKLPQPTVPAAQSLTPQLEKPRFSLQQQEQFLRYQSAVDRPLDVLAQVSRGETPSIEAVEAIKTVYPDLHKKLVDLAFDAGSRAKKPLDYQTRVKFSQLLGVPVDPSMNPATLASIQSSFAPVSSGPNAPQSSQIKPPPRPIKLAQLSEDESGPRNYY